VQRAQSLGGHVLPHASIQRGVKRPSFGLLAGIRHPLKLPAPLGLALCHSTIHTSSEGGAGLPKELGKQAGGQWPIPSTSTDLALVAPISCLAVLAGGVALNSPCGAGIPLGSSGWPSNRLQTADPKRGHKMASIPQCRLTLRCEGVGRKRD
jgi:hypothetical protein